MFSRNSLALYLVAGTQDCRHLPASAADNLLGILETALQNGISCFQLREKGSGALQDAAEVARLAAACRTLCHQYAVPFVVNDDAALALAVGADGVHLGQQDASAADVRALCGGRLLIGLSNSSVYECLQSSRTDADYLAAGPLFPTISKDDAAPPAGIGLIRRIRAAGITQPLVAIGGIDAARAAGVRAAGADGVAVVSAVCRSADPAAAVRLLKEAV